MPQQQNLQQPQQNQEQMVESNYKLDSSESATKENGGYVFMKGPQRKEFLQKKPKNYDEAWTRFLFASLKVFQDQILSDNLPVNLT